MVLLMENLPDNKLCVISLTELQGENYVWRLKENQ